MESKLKVDYGVNTNQVVKKVALFESPRSLKMTFFHLEKKNNSEIHCQYCPFSSCVDGKLFPIEVSFRHRR